MTVGVSTASRRALTVLGAMELFFEQLQLVINKQNKGKIQSPFLRNLQFVFLELRTFLNSSPELGTNPVELWVQQLCGQETPVKVFIGLFRLMSVRKKENKTMTKIILVNTISQKIIVFPYIQIFSSSNFGRLYLFVSVKYKVQ